MREHHGQLGDLRQSVRTKKQARPSQQIVNPQGTFTEESRDALLGAAIAAPSPDNSQPWIFDLHPQGFDLRLDPSRLGMFFDVSGLCTAMAAGAVIENISVQAAALGLATTCRFRRGHSHEIASFRFRSADGVQGVSSGASNIYERCTDRTLYDISRPLGQDVMGDLGDCVSRDDAYGCQFYTGDDRRRAIGLMTATDRLRFSHKTVHQDFYKLLRFGEDGARLRDGLAERTLGLGRIFVAALKLMRPWWLARALNALGVDALSAVRATWLSCRSAPGLVALTHRGPCDYVQAGRVMQRFWLQATKLGLSAQPFGALTFFLARLHLAQGQGFSARHMRVLRRIEAGFAEITPGFTPKQDQVIMLFRLGYAKHQTPRAYRRPMADFIGTAPTHRGPR